MKKLFFTLFLCFLVINSYAIKISTPYVSVWWLEKNLDKVILLDVRRSKQDFYKGHIPNAVFVDKSKVRVDKIIMGKSVKGFLPEKEYFQNFLRSLGINNDSAVVIYTKQRKHINAKYAARLYWQFKVYGFENVALLDGGYYKWVNDIKKIEKGAGKAVTKGNVVLKDVNHEILADISEVKKAINDKNSIIIDFREMAYYLGIKTKSYIAYSGHIPTAFSVSEDLFFNDDGTFISKNDMEKTLFALNIDIHKPIIVYCNTGNHSALGWFILHEILKADSVKNFDGSLIEWTTYELPTKKYVIENFSN
ncbi:sulfurtransferase [Deferribacter autotrophicus]|uniref:Sulfurtransferase n=1 Tax=Deferribacter autotrophicus TaxID=500465 RepID=A0A5A8F3R3_9BACT|nr:rhodanese-like domain-containing protein [Deferribacter autotrophicus]KAA0258166.1 sulfurtransferase [Deferribacter autotrophicus]